MNSATPTPFGDHDPTRRQTVNGAVIPEAAAHDLAGCTLDELRELPFHVQLGADFSAHD